MFLQTKIDLRSKLLILLLVAALAPLLAVRAIDTLGIRQLGERVSTEVHQKMSSETERGLAQIIEAIAVLIHREELISRLILEKQAVAIEARLARGWEESMADRPVMAPADFKPGGAAEATLEPSSRHGRVTVEEQVQPQLVSFTHQVALLLPGAEPQRARQLAQILADMPQIYRRAQVDFPGRLLWQYTSLVDGVHLAFPGKSDYPADYDSRERSWFKAAVAAPGGTGGQDEVVWNPPMIDAVSGQIILTLSRRIRWPDGQLAGVTAIDIPLDTVLDDTRLGVDWSSEARLMIVGMADRVTLGDQVEIPPGYSASAQQLPVIYADTAADYGARDWREGIRFRVLAMDDAGALGQLIAGIRSERKGALRTTWQGRSMVVAHGPTAASTPMAVVVAAPLDLVAQQAHRLEDQVWEEVATLLTWTHVVAVVVMIGVVALAWRGSRSVTRPVTDMAAAAGRIARGDLEAHVEVGHRRDELGDLGRAFNAMVPKLQEHLDLQHAMGVAMEVQQCLLPREAPTIAGLEIAGLSDYCDETGGDYYDYLMLESFGESRVDIALGDVTGHGIPSALMMSTARALIRARSGQPGALPAVMGDVNREICHSRFKSRFMTLFYLQVEMGPQVVVRWLSAGHDPAIVYDPRTDAFEAWEGEDMPLGVEASWEFHAAERTLPDARGSQRVVVLGTDGIWEARSPEPEDALYGKERLEGVIRQHAAASAERIAQAILADVHAFRGEREQLDDITLVVLKFV